MVLAMEIVVKKQRQNLELSLVLNLTMATSLVVNQKRNLEMNLVMMAPPPQEHLMMIAQMRKMKRREMKNFIKLLSFQKLIKKNKKLIALHMKKKRKNQQRKLLQHKRPKKRQSIMRNLKSRSKMQKLDYAR